MSEPYAKIIADSINENGDRLSTLEIRFHRFVLAEFNTHRVFSRNSASSRAIPVKKQLDRLWKGPAVPLSWPLEQRGMQGGDELDQESSVLANRHWIGARDEAIYRAQKLMELGVHKSVTNRLLEPFMWHTVICTATAWENFFHQRCSPLAQPEIRVAAEMMKAAYDASEPRELTEGTWHLPYIEEEDWRAMTSSTSLGESMYPLATKISAARCARVSYLTQDGARDIEKDLALYERLVTARPPHWSPLEHVATPWPENRNVKGMPFTALDGNAYVSQGSTPKVGNLLGWRSLRTEVEAEKAESTYC